MDSTSRFSTTAIGIACGAGAAVFWAAGFVGARHGIDIGFSPADLTFHRCYLGQEVMARLKNLGQVRRRLHVVRGRGAPPERLAVLYQGGKKIGELRSIAHHQEGFVALAMLALINLNSRAGLGLTPTGPETIWLGAHE